MLCSSRGSPGPAPRPGPAAAEGTRAPGRCRCSLGCEGTRDSPAPAAASREGWAAFGEPPSAVTGHPEPCHGEPPSAVTKRCLSLRDHLASLPLRYQSRCHRARRRAGIYSPGGPASSGWWLHAKTNSNKHIGPTSSVCYLSNFSEWEKMQNYTMFLGSCILPLVSPQGTGDVTKSDIKC